MIFVMIVDINYTMSSFKTVYDREEARMVMHDAMAAANAVVPEIKDHEDAHEWRKTYESVIAAAPENIRPLCHMLQRRNTKKSLN
jgi:hypothetical protein